MQQSLTLNSDQIRGGLFGFITKPKTPSSRALIIFLGFLLQIIVYYGVFVNFPPDAPTLETSTIPYFDFSKSVSQTITFVGSFLVGLGDSSLNTQLMNVLAGRYKETSASAFAIFKLVQSLMSAIAFFYAGALALPYQLLIVVIFLFFGTLAFFIVLFDDDSSAHIGHSSTLSTAILTEGEPVNVDDEDRQ
ncbi:unnamed protein product [Didymodactylos carnosus]|uniref:UNC93-like protein MFSD11 n=1 Tax=Didymodactylos carnosus TaxID=1234261 RepID=A0A814ERZ3_9BILA|nr:unnamed protein product [Didymodactylos carnosus]CAF0973177.1 unnamed protein product [Didymodactylos carnosus]CAF3569836.1 unnamed protein product [Didymodactylos carnosus]CAF3746090.1 unnamed protein product [Didymodactylos carnosus]